MWLFLQILGLIVIFSAAIAGASAAPWLPTKPKDRQHLLDHLKLEPGQKVIDLGCGDGSLLFAVARKYPEAKCVGYDISLLPLFLGWSRKILKPRLYKHVSLRFGNLFKQNVAQADVIFILLLPKSYPRLLKSLAHNLKPEARVFVEAWPFPGITPHETLRREGLLSIFIYTAKEMNQG